MTSEEHGSESPPEASAAAKDVLGAYIRAQRRMADLSLRQLAEMTNISNAYLSQIERGLHQPSLRILRSLAQVLDIPAEDLLSHTGLGGSDRTQAQPSGGTEAAILADEGLSTEEKDVLLRLYRTFLGRRSITPEGAGPSEP